MHHFIITNFVLCVRKRNSPYLHQLINTAAHTNPYTSTVHMLEYNSVVIIIQRNRIFVKRVFLEQEKFQKVVG